jgi:UDP-apiose/xylose synthase
MVARPEAAQGQIFNVGNPDNEISIAGLADMMIALYQELRGEDRGRLYRVEHVSGRKFYGEGYEDSDRRVPDIDKARRLLGWNPRTGLKETLRRTMRAYVEQYGQSRALREAS